MPYKVNAHTGEFDLVGMSDAEKAAYLKLNQSTPQTVTGGRPVFNGGTTNNDDIILKAGKKLILDGA